MPIIILPRVKALHRLFSFFFHLERIHFLRIIPCISVLRCYTDVKNPELENQIEEVLKRHEIYYTKSEVWIESERLYEVLYETDA